MKSYNQKTFVFAILIIGSQFLSCQQKQSNYTKIEPAHIDQIHGSQLARLTLTQDAAERINIQTSILYSQKPVSDTSPTTPAQKIIPYTSILYDSQGKTWLYQNPSPLVYARHAINIDFIDGNTVALLDGPPAGTPIVTQGAAELFGIEFKVGH